MQQEGRKGEEEGKGKGDRKEKEEGTRGSDIEAECDPFFSPTSA